MISKHPTRDITIISFCKGKTVTYVAGINDNGNASIAFGEDLSPENLRDKDIKLCIELDMESLTHLIANFERLQIELEDYKTDGSDN